MKKLIYLIWFIVLIFLSSFNFNRREYSRIKPYAYNKKYWQFKGEPLYLLGANKEDNAFQSDGLKTYLEELHKTGGNYFRNVMSDRDKGNIKAFVLLENGKYDLNQWNEYYWQKFRNMLEWSSEMGIIVHITLWDRFDHYDQSKNAQLWQESAWNPINNINYTRSETGLKATYPVHPAKGTNSFFKSPPTMENNPKLLYFQHKFIKRVLDLSINYGNVLYNTGNEHQVEMEEWDHYWCNFIRNYADSVGISIEVTAMFDHQNFYPVVNHENMYSFIEGSKIGSRWTKPGETQYKDALQLLNQVAKVEVRPVNAVKVRTQSIVNNAQERLWRPLMAGFAALSHHRHTSGYTSGKGAGKVDGINTWPSGGLGFTEMGRNNLKAMRLFTDIIVPWECIPRQDLLQDRKEDEAYLLASEGFSYGLYFPSGSGSVKLDLSRQQKRFKVQWIDIGKGRISKEYSVDGGKLLFIEVPYQVEHGWSCCITAV